MAFLKARGHYAMRQLLAKDLRILRRSPLLVALLVIYPVVIATLIGFALSRGPDKPQVAFVNLVPVVGQRDRAGRQADRRHAPGRPAVQGHRPGAGEDARRGHQEGA